VTEVTLEHREEGILFQKFKRRKNQGNQGGKKEAQQLRVVGFFSFVSLSLPLTPFR